MSVELSVTGLDAGLWESLVKAWVDSQDMAIGDTSPDEEGAVHLHAAGSVRGVVVWFDSETGRARVRLGHLASRVDWAMARELLAAAIAPISAAHAEGSTVELAAESGSERRAELRVEDTLLEPAELAPAAWGRRAKAAVQHDLQALRAVITRHGGPLWLPAQEWDVPVNEQDLVGEPVIVETRLATRVSRIAGAESARALHVRRPENPSGEARIAVWPMAPTRILAVDDVVVEVEDGFGLVALDTLAEILGDTMERIGQDPVRYYLPLLEADDPRRARVVAATRPLG